MSTQTSPYMLIFRETTPERYAAMSREQRKEALLNWNAWCGEAASRGVFHHGSSLAPDGRVVSRVRASRPVDGPFAEAKELVGGFLMIDLASMEEAVAIAEACPSLQYGMEIEIRPLSPTCHLARSLGWSTMQEPVAV